MKLENINGRFEIRTEGDEFQLWVEHKNMMVHIVMSEFNPKVTCWRNRKEVPSKMKVRNLSYKV